MYEDNDYNFGTVWSRFIPVWQTDYSIGDSVTFLTMIDDTANTEHFLQTVVIAGASQLLAPALALISATIMF